jgi:hypothetical protein
MLLRAPVHSVSTGAPSTRTRTYVRRARASRAAQTIAAAAVQRFHYVFPGSVEWKANQHSEDSRGKGLEAQI